MIKTGIVEIFVKNWLQQKLKSFFQLQKTKFQGFVIRNIGIKHDLLKQLSQIIKMPLVLNSGVIEEIRLNIPWQKLLFAKEESIKITISGLKISTRLPVDLQKEYGQLQKRKEVEQYTQQFYKKKESKISFLNKLKQYFFGTFSVEVKDIELQIAVQMKYSIIGVLSIKSLKFEKDLITNKSRFEIHGLSFGYKFLKESRQENIISNADLLVTGNKFQDSHQTYLSVKNLQVFFTNENFNDIRRFISLISWHNSFSKIPYCLWQAKPGIFSQIKPIKKVIYIAKMIEQFRKEQKGKKMQDIIKRRREYINKFSQYQQNRKNQKVKFELIQLEKDIDVWRLKQYRKFWFLRELNKSNQQKVSEQKKSKNWLSYWFPKGTENQIEELTKCMAINGIEVKKLVTMSLKRIQVSLGIKSINGKQPFLNLIAQNSQLNLTSIPVKTIQKQKNVVIETQIEYSKQVKFTIQKFMIQFDKYLGHCPKHQYFLSQITEKQEPNNQESSFDEFQDIINMFQLQKKQKQLLIKITPIRIKINEEVLQKFQVFKLEIINSTFSSSEELIFRQNMSLIDNCGDDQSENKIQFSTSLQVNIVENMFDKRTETISLFLNDLYLFQHNSVLVFKVPQLICSAELLHSEISQQSFAEVEIQQKIELFRTSVSVNNQKKIMIETTITINQIQIRFEKSIHLKKVIRLFVKVIPKQKIKKPLYRLKQLRRKQSIGQEFIDACQNLNQHLNRSMTSSIQSKAYQSMIKEKKDKLLKICVERVKIVIEQSQFQLSQTSLSIFQFPLSKSISTSQQPKYISITILNIKNFYQNLQLVQSQIRRLTQLKFGSKPIDKDIKRNSEISSNQLYFNISQFNFSVELYANSKPTFLLNFNNICFQLSNNRTITCQMKMHLAKVQTKIDKNIKNKQRGLQHRICEKGQQWKQRFHEGSEMKDKDKSFNGIRQQVSEYLIQPLQFEYRYQKKYNKQEKSISINCLNINIKPNTLLEIGKCYDFFNQPKTQRYLLQNSTVTHIKIEEYQLKQGRYENKASSANKLTKYLKQSGKVEVGSPKLRIQFQDTSKKLDLVDQYDNCNGEEIIRLTQKLWLIKRYVSQYNFEFYSNFRIVNKQSYNILVRFVRNKKELTIYRQNELSRGTILFDGVQKISKFKRSTSLYSKTQEISLEKDKIQEDEFQNISEFKKVKVKDLMQIIDIKNSTQKSDSDNTHFRGSQKDDENLILERQLKPGQIVQVAIDSEEYFVELYQIGDKDNIFTSYKSFQIKELMYKTKQLAIVSLESNQQRQSSLVIKRTEEHCNNIKLFNLQILSPIVIISKIPFPLRFCFIKQQVDYLETINFRDKQIRKRSFESTSERIQPFNISRITKEKYKEIAEIEIQIKGYRKKFKFDTSNYEQQIKEESQAELQNNGDKLLQQLQTTSLFRQQKQDDTLFLINYRDHLCLNNGDQQLQLAIEIIISKNTMKISIFSESIYLNFAASDLMLNILEQNYRYPSIKLQQFCYPQQHQTNYQQFLRMSNEKMRQQKVLKQLFRIYSENVGVFTGNFKQKSIRGVAFGPQGKELSNYDYSDFFNHESRDDFQNKSSKQILYSNNLNNTKIIVRKITISNKPVNLYIFFPSLYIVNKSQWSFFIKRENEKPIRLSKHSTGYFLVDDIISIQSCEEYDQICFNQWMKLSLNMLGIIYYAKQMNSSNGYESREYQLRKKRLKKAPKLLFKIVMTKYEYGYQILIQEQQYPPITFINRYTSRIQIKQQIQQSIEQIQPNQTVQYAAKRAGHQPKFIISKVENYEFKKCSQLSLDEELNVKQKKDDTDIHIIIQEYKDKKVIIFESKDQGVKNKVLSSINNEDFLLQRIQKFSLSIKKIQISILSNLNKELTCTCIEDLDFAVEKKNTKKYMKFVVQNVEIYSYNALKPSYLFSGKKAGFQLLKKQFNDQKVLGSSQIKPKNKGRQSIPSSNISSNPLSSSSSNTLINTQLIINYHKYAIIVEKCDIKLSEIVIILNANTVIDFIKYFYKDCLDLIDILKKYERSREVIKNFQKLFNDKRENNPARLSDDSSSFNYQTQNQGRFNRRNSFTTKGLIKKKPFTTSQDNLHIGQNKSYNQRKEQQISIQNRNFIIQSFTWHGLSLTIKFENLENLQYFIRKKQIKYLLKFINWIGDLRPITFNSTSISYQQYTILKLIQLVDLKKFKNQISQIFLQYPAQELYHISSLITKFLGLNDLQEQSQLWRTFKRLTKSILKVSKKIIVNSLGNIDEDKEKDKNALSIQKKNYIEQFLQQTFEQDSTLERIIKFKYPEWKLNEQKNQNKLSIKFNRLQRYNQPDRFLIYDPYFSRVMLALNDHTGNKFFKKIVKIQSINNQSFMGLTEDWFVLYNLKQQQWIVVRPEEVLQLKILKVRTKHRITLGMYKKPGFQKSSDQQLVITILSDKNEGKRSQIQEHQYRNIKILIEQLKEIEEYLRQVKLSKMY